MTGESAQTPHIPRASWLHAKYARVVLTAGRVYADILRAPRADFPWLSDIEQDQLRQTQIEDGESLRVLGRIGDFSLIMKWDQVIGWLPTALIAEDSALDRLRAPEVDRIEGTVFFQTWRGTRYVWGGFTRHGIDCSGLTQRYFLEVRGSVIPKNSFDQRKICVEKSIAEISDEDLVFCRRKNPGNSDHHVGIFFGGDIWHAHLTSGVIRQSFLEFQRDYNIEFIGRLRLP